MSEFCLSCFNRFSECGLTEKDVILTGDEELYEDCDQMKQTVIRFRRDTVWFKLKKALRK